MKRVCIVTATRAEYGLLRWVIDRVHHAPELELQLVVTGAHLLEEQGYTYRFIEEDGYPIAAKVDMHLSSESICDIVKSMGQCSIGFSDAFQKLNPDMIVVLGDRYELIPIVSSALLFRIPVAHIGGGDVTEGAIDDEVRNAVTMMATLHFPGTGDSAENIIRMRGSDKGCYLVGETGLENFIRLKLLNKEELAESLSLDLIKKWCLVTMHPETKLSLDDNMDMVESLFNVMSRTGGIQYIITKANADFGGADINAFWSVKAEKHPDRIKLFSSLGQLRYLSMMRHVDLLAGNSSSGIVEAPFLGTPVVNIGERQTGRHICPNVICCGRDEDSISEAFNCALTADKVVDTYWGDGNTSGKIVSFIKEYLKLV